MATAKIVGKEENEPRNPVSTVTGTLVSVANEAIFAWVGWVAVRNTGEPEAEAVWIQNYCNF
jgi:hypothetical protein